MLHYILKHGVEFQVFDYCHIGEDSISLRTVAYELSDEIELGHCIRSMDLNHS